jgi:pre-mRNA-splicing factor 18
MDKVEKVLDQETAQGSSKGEQSKNESDLYECLIVYDELIDMIPEANKGDMDADVKIVSEFIKFMMTKWHQALSKRSPDEQSSVMGKRETGIHTQTRTYLKPLLRMLKKQTVTDDVRDSLVKMVVFTLQKDYIFGHEAYMEMAVGNAPWPIGVTNAGIHARPARENIFSKNVAHVLNDETQRKYIQGLKRLMTKAQVYYPTDPSRSIDYVRKEQSTTTNTD